MIVIRRHHPLQGEQFDVLMGGKERIVIQLKDGSSMRIPRSWTDADGALPVHNPRESVFSVDSLRQMFELLDAFLGR